MAINIDRVNLKLKAISEKNIDNLVLNKVFLPSLGKSYTKTTLNRWLKKLTDVLNDVKNNQYTDEQIASFVKNIYDGLSDNDKLIADKIKANKFYWSQIGQAENRDNLSLLILYKYITG